MAATDPGNRPLSPHLQIYRPQLTSMSSIFARITGNALILGTVLVVWWLVAAATGPEAFALADWVLTSWIGDIVMLGSLWAVWYHTLAGIRHLLWDNGFALDLDVSEKLGIAIILGSFLLTAATALVVIFL